MDGVGDVDAGGKEGWTTFADNNSIVEEAAVRTRFTGLFRGAGKGAPRATPRLR